MKVAFVKNGFLNAVVAFFWSERGIDFQLFGRDEKRAFFVRGLEERVCSRDCSVYFGDCVGN